MDAELEFKLKCFCSLEPLPGKKLKGQLTLFLILCLVALPPTLCWRGGSKGAGVPTHETVPTLAPPGTPAREAVVLRTKRTAFTYKQVQAAPGAHSQG